MSENVVTAPASSAKPRWSRLPNKWVIESAGLTRFPAGKHTGETTAALKLLLTIVLHAENKTAAAVGHNQGSACLSYDELMALTDLSRSMIATGLKRLRQEGRISVRSEGRGRKSRYVLSDYGTNDTWAKVPNRALYRSNRTDRIAVLHELSPRRESDCNALKLYILFCSFRDSQTQKAVIGYNLIGQYTGIPERKIRRAISVLIEHGLVHVDREKTSADKRNHPNKYEIIGL